MSHAERKLNHATNLFVDIIKSRVPDIADLLGGVAKQRPVLPILALKVLLALLQFYEGLVLQL